jgi:hypothetical protein
MLPKALQTVAKVSHCPRELLWRKCYVKGCNFIYLCVISQFP